MTRQILFRGKRVDNGEWVEGYYWRDCTNGKHKVTISDMGNDNFVCNEVIPETVGQYAGLCDRNGVKIFEHDIVEMWGKFHEIKFMNGAFEFIKSDSKKQNMIDTTICQVIGNIHDNKELI